MKFLHQDLKKVLASLGLLALLIAALPAQTSESQVVRRFGIFVGANNGGAERAKLQWAVSDAQRMNQVMNELGGMAPEDSLMMIDPRQSDIQQALTGMRLQVASAQSESRRVEFMFYYSGHSDEEGLLLNNERLSYKNLRQAITDVKADVTIAVLDSCASGAFTRTKGGVRVQPFLVDASNDMRGYAFLTSASETESAQESDRLGASFFTHYLVSALRGAANTNGNGRVTLNDAYRYAFNETLARTETTTSGPQHASYDINLSGTGDLVLSDLSQPSASILLKEDMEGRVFIRDQKGYLVMEVNKVLGKSSVLAMPPGAYTLRIESPAGTFQAPAKLVLKQQYAIGMANFQRATVVATRSRGSSPADPVIEDTGSTDVLVSNVLEQARARYAKSQFNANPETVPPALAPENPSVNPPEAPAETKVNASIKIDLPDFSNLDGIGAWEFITQIIQGQSEASASPTPALAASSQTSPPQLENRAPAAKPSPGPASELVDGEAIPRVLFHFDLVPGLGSSGGKAVVSTFTFSPLLGWVAGNNGLMASLFLNFSSGLEHGFQLSSLLNSAGQLQGGQFAAIGNITGSESRGIQAAGLFNIAKESFTGFQTAVLFNSIGGDANGFQAAALFNYAGGGMGGFTPAGLFNIAGGDMVGTQSAGLFNIVGKNGVGFQAAGLFNRAAGFKGLQVAGLLNVDDDAHGVVIAPINIMGKFDGVPVGVVNIIGNGIHDISYWYNFSDRSWFGFLNGSTNFYSIAYAGFDLFNAPEELKGLTIGLGVGGRLKFAKVLFIDLEASIKRPSYGSTAEERLGSIFGLASNEGINGGSINLVPNGRLNFGLDLTFFKAFLGIGMDFFGPGLMDPVNYKVSSTGWQTNLPKTGSSVLVNFNLGASFSF